MLGTTGHSNYYTHTETGASRGRDARDNWSLELLHTHRDRSIKGPWCSGQLVTRTTTHTPRQEHQGAVMLGTTGHSNYYTHTETGASRGRDARDNWSLELLHTHRDRGAVMLGTIGHSNYYTHTETGASRGRDARDNWSLELLHTHRDRSIKGPWCSGQLVTRTTTHTPRQEHQGAVMLGTTGHSNYCTHTETGASRGRDARDNWWLELLHTHRDRSIKGPWCSGQLVTRTTAHTHTPRQEHQGAVMLGTIGHSNYYTHTETGASRGRDARDNWSLELLHTHRDRSIKGPWCSGQLVTRTTAHTPRQEHQGAVMLGTIGHSNYYTHTETGGPWCSGQLVTRTTTHTPRQEHQGAVMLGTTGHSNYCTHTETGASRGRDARDNWSLELLHTHRDRSIKGPWCSGQLVTRTTAHTPRQEHQGAVMLGTTGHSNYCTHTHTETGASRGRDARDNWSLELLHTHRDRSIKGPWCSGQLVTRTTAHTPRQEHQGAVMLGTTGHSNYCTHTETGASRGRDARDNWSLELLHTHRDRGAVMLGTTGHSNYCTNTETGGPWCSGQLVTRTTAHTPRQGGRDARDNWSLELPHTHTPRQGGPWCSGQLVTRTTAHTPRQGGRDALDNWSLELLHTHRDRGAVMLGTTGHSNYHTHTHRDRGAVMLGTTGHSNYHTHTHTETGGPWCSGQLVTRTTTHTHTETGGPWCSGQLVTRTTTHTHTETGGPWCSGQLVTRTTTHTHTPRQGGRDARDNWSLELPHTHTHTETGGPWCSGQLVTRTTTHTHTETGGRWCSGQLVTRTTTHTHTHQDRGAVMLGTTGHSNYHTHTETGGPWCSGQLVTRTTTHTPRQGGRDARDNWSLELLHTHTHRDRSIKGPWCSGQLVTRTTTHTHTPRQEHQGAVMLGTTGHSNYYTHTETGASRGRDARDNWSLELSQVDGHWDFLFLFCCFVVFLVLNFSITRLCWLQSVLFILRIKVKCSISRIKICYFR